MRAFLRGPAAPALLAIVALVWVAVGYETAPEDDAQTSQTPAHRVYSAEARALLGGLETGDEIEGDWVVVEIYGPLDRQIFIVLQLHRSRLELRVVPRGVSDELALLTDERFNFHYSFTEGTPEASEHAVETAVIGIRARIVHDLPIPLGM